MKQTADKMIMALQDTSREICLNNQNTVKVINEQSLKFRMDAIMSLAGIMVTILLQ